MRYIVGGENRRRRHRGLDDGDDGKGRSKGNEGLPMSHRRGTRMRLQFLHDVEFVLEADRLLLRVVLFALRQHLSKFLCAHRQVQALGPGLAVVRTIPDTQAAVTRAVVHVVHAAVAVFPHVGLFVGRCLHNGGAVAVRRVVGIDRLLRALK